MRTKHSVPAAAAGGAEQATDVVNVDDIENVDPDPKGPKKFQEVLPDPWNKGTDLCKEYHYYFVNINTKRDAPTRFVPDDRMCHCGESFDSPGGVVNMCHNILQTVSVGQPQPKENTSGNMLGHNI